MGNMWRYIVWDLGSGTSDVCYGVSLWEKTRASDTMWVFGRVGVCHEIEVVRFSAIRGVAPVQVVWA